VNGYIEVDKGCFFYMQEVDSDRLDALIETMQRINDELDEDASEDESYDIIASQNAECKYHCFELF
jgi:hypothetical protein